MIRNAYRPKYKQLKRLVGHSKSLGMVLFECPIFTETYFDTPGHHDTNRHLTLTLIPEP